MHSEVPKWFALKNNVRKFRNQVHILVTISLIQILIIDISLVHV